MDYPSQLSDGVTSVRSTELLSENSFIRIVPRPNFNHGCHSMDKTDYHKLLPRFLRHCRWYIYIPLIDSSPLIIVAVETIAFHGGIIATCCLLMKITDILQSTFNSNPPPISSIRREFRYHPSLPTHPKSAPIIDLLFFEYRLSLISLSLFYSSLTKLFLLLLLTIWLPAPTSIIPKPETPLPEWTKHLQWANSNRNLLTHVLETLDDDKLDREWIVRNILGGMSAGFGLRGKFSCLNFVNHTTRSMLLFLFAVILGIHPFFTTTMILAGWIAKTAVATVVSRWVSGNDSRTGEAWLAYSIS